MKVYTFFTNTHKEFVKIFTESFPFEDGFDLEIKYFPQECKTGSFMDDGWSDTMKRKIEYILYSLEKTKNGEIFIHSDIDIVFYGNIKDDILRLINGYDILFQRDSKNENESLCMGFFACVKNEKTVNFFNNISKNLNKYHNDQVAVNMLIKKSGLKYGNLPDTYYTVGVENGLWHGSEDIKIPNNILVHHANFAIGVDNKIKLINLVKNKMIKK